MSYPIFSGPVLVGVLVDPAAAEPLARICAAELARRRNAGLAVGGHIADAVHALQIAARARAVVSVDGQESRTSADPPRSWTTNELADQLHVSVRHVSRLARAAGVSRLGVGVWPGEALAAIRTYRRTKGQD